MPHHLVDDFSYVGGFVDSSDVMRVIAQADALNEADTPNTTLLKWVLSEGKRYGFNMQSYVNRIYAQRTPVVELFALSPDGQVNTWSSQGASVETVGGPDDGPSAHGVLRDLNWIGQHLYSAGMGGQVYRREGRDRWVHFDRGVLQEPNTTDVVGFNAIAGRAEGEMYAVGFGGQMAVCDGKKWRSLDSPTNVILNAVTVRADGRVFVCGQQGVILEGRGDEWREIPQDLTEEQFWDLEWFGDELYLAASDGLFRLTAKGLVEPVSAAERDDSSPRTVHSDDGVLLCVGTKSAVWTKDGRKWFDLV